MSVRASQSGRAPTVAAFPWLGLLVLASTTFACVTSEFLPTALLPEIAAGLDVSQSQIGFLVTVYAGTVVLSAPLLTSLTRRFQRKHLVIAVLCVFAVTNVMVAVAPNYAVVLTARVLGGLAHGLFWSVVGAYSAHLVPKAQLARAVAITSGGATTAFVLGIPLGATLGHALGWRLAFLTMAVVIAVLTLLVALYLPKVRHELDLRTGEVPIAARKDPTMVAVGLLCVIVAVVMVAQNLFYTFIVPYLVEVAEFSEESVPLLLFLYGSAGAVSLFIVAVVATRFPRASLITALLIVVIAVLTIGAFPRATPVVIAAMAVWGVAFGCGPVLLQTRMMQTASARIRDLSSAWLTVAFNLGIGGGAFIGALVLQGAGIAVLPFVEAAVLVAGIALILTTDLVLRRRATNPR